MGDGPDLAVANKRCQPTVVANCINDGTRRIWPTGPITENVGVSSQQGLGQFADVDGDGKIEFDWVRRTTAGSDSVSVLINGTPFPSNSVPFITGQPASRSSLVGTHPPHLALAPRPTGVPQAA